MEEIALKKSIEPGIVLLPVIGKCSGTVQAQIKAIGRISTNLRVVNSIDIHKIVAG